MPGTDLDIDPATGDFVDDNAGDWVEVSHLGPAIRHQLLDSKGLWFADMDAGSEAYLIVRKANRATALRLEDAWTAALGIFVATGQAENLVLETTTDQFGRLAIEGSLVDVKHGQLDITPLLTFGVGQG